MIRRWYHYVDGRKVYWHGEPVQIGDTRIAHPTEEQLLEAGYEYEDIDPHPEPTLDQVKQMKISEIEEYDRSENVNAFYINDQPYWYYPEDRANFRLTLQDAIEFGIESFQFLGYTIDPHEGLQMIKQINLYAAATWEVTEAHKKNVMALQTKEEVQNYDYTVGYPQKLYYTLPEGNVLQNN